MNAVLITAIVIVIVGVVLLGIATSISGIISTSKNDGLKTTLLAAAGTNGFDAIFAILASVCGFIYAGRRIGIPLADRKNKQSPAYKKAAGWGIAFIVMLAIVLILYVIVIILDLVARANSDLDATQQRAMTAAIVLNAIGFILIAVGVIIMIVQASRGGKQGYSAGEGVKRLSKPKP